MEREDLLFDDFERVGSPWKKDGEPAFRFLNRTTWEPAGQARTLLEEIYALYPSGEARQLRGRFRSDKGNQHEGALWELWLFAALGPRTVKVRADTPDFEFEWGGEEYLLEATAFDQYMNSDKHEQQVFATIEDKVSSPHFFLDIAQWGELKSTPPQDAYLRPIADLLELAPEHWNEATARTEINLDSYAEGTYRLRVALLPKSGDDPDGRLIGIRGFEWVALGPLEDEWVARFFNGVGRKGKKLKKRNGSAYLAVSVPSDPQIPAQTIAMRALYGRPWEGGEPVLDCFWQQGGGSRNGHVHGVVVCGTLKATGLDSAQFGCRLYMAPGAEEPPEPLSRLPRVWLDGDTLCRQPGEELGVLVRAGLGASP